MSTLGPMDIGASEHWGKMGIWGKCTPGKMSTRANQQMGILGAMNMDIVGVGGVGVEGGWGRRGFRVGGVEKEGFGVGGVGGLGSQELGTEGRVGVRGLGLGPGG